MKNQVKQHTPELFKVINDHLSTLDENLEIDQIRFKPKNVLKAGCHYVTQCRNVRDPKTGKITHVCKQVLVC